MTPYIASVATSSSCKGEHYTGLLEVQIKVDTPSLNSWLLEKSYMMVIGVEISRIIMKCHSVSPFVAKLGSTESTCDGLLRSVVPSDLGNTKRF